MKLDWTPIEILQVERAAEILEPCCPDTGIPLWATLRPLFFEVILSDLFYGVPIGSRETSAGLSSKLKKVASISRSFVHNASKFISIERSCPIVLMATGARFIKRDGVYFNSLSDYFIDAVPTRTLAIEDLFDWRWPYPRHNNNVLIQTPLRVSGVMKGRLRAGAYEKAARELVDSLAARASTVLDWKMDEQRRAYFINVCMNGAASYLPRFRTYQNIFKKAKARILIKEEACYGGPNNACAVLAAKQEGMITAEYQHGAVSPGHMGYNFDSVIAENQAYRKILPEYFLTYGSWWGEQMNAPVKKLAIGNPHRAAVIDTSAVEPSQNRQILVLGDGIETNLYLDLCNRLAADLGKWFEVIFRPHPLERSSVWENYPSGFAGAIKIDPYQDIYSSFRAAEAVVSEVSTGLFEAIGLVPKVFIWDTPKSRFAYPEHPFQRFNRPDELASLILDDNAGRITAERHESIWSSNWQRNYSDFIEQAIQS